ncbi:Acetyltransferase (GNAT) family domain-containing protein [Ceratobasidium theobromae]|uniref:Acetyltransferase (GNAT) family domain-containing protein n=1 Tax=Ceratobasidium theobromae TaxID=1582974 RepID=A0A5N5QF87_9AGAM|nr:Acetyltransferase (GNAT) family domain-containing protein [Ceratobasidium theobromae]
MFGQPPLSESQISRLPLEFMPLGSHQQDVFTDVLLSIWIALAESGSLATLPPVPDIVGFADSCAVFYLVFHTRPKELQLPPSAHLTNSPYSNQASSSQSTGPDFRIRPAIPPCDDTYHESAYDTDAGFDTGLYSDTSLGEVIGCVYLAYSPLGNNTADIGIALRPEARGRGFGRAAITRTLRHAFETLQIHRVVANVFGPGGPDRKESARESGTVRWVFEKMGFVPEGVQRAAGFSASSGEWRDVYPLAMLDTDWVRLTMRSAPRSGITSPWDTLIERHHHEREQLSEWMEDESWGRLRRTGSTETIKCVDDQASNDDKGKGPETSPPHSPSNPFEFDTNDTSDPFNGDIFDTDYEFSDSSSYVRLDSPTGLAPASASAPAPAPLLASQYREMESDSDVSVPSDWEWRSATPSTDCEFEYSIISSRASSLPLPLPPPRAPPNYPPPPTPPAATERIDQSSPSSESEHESLDFCLDDSEGVDTDGFESVGYPGGGHGHARAQSSTSSRAIRTARTSRTSHRSRVSGLRPPPRR